MKIAVLYTLLLAAFPFHAFSEVYLLSSEEEEKYLKEEFVYLSDEEYAKETMDMLNAFDSNTPEKIRKLISETPKKYKSNIDFVYRYSEALTDFCSIKKHTQDQLKKFGEIWDYKTIQLISKYADAISDRFDELGLEDSTLDKLAFLEGNIERLLDDIEDSKNILHKEEDFDNPVILMKVLKDERRSEEDAKRFFLRDLAKRLAKEKKAKDRQKWIDKGVDLKPMEEILFQMENDVSYYPKMKDRIDFVGKYLLLLKEAADKNNKAQLEYLGSKKNITSVYNYSLTLLELYKHNPRLNTETREVEIKNLLTMQTILKPIYDKAVMGRFHKKAKIKYRTLETDLAKFDIRKMNKKEVGFFDNYLTELKKEFENDSTEKFLEKVFRSDPKDQEFFLANYKKANFDKLISLMQEEKKNWYIQDKVEVDSERYDLPNNSTRIAYIIVPKKHLTSMKDRGLFFQGLRFFYSNDRWLFAPCKVYQISEFDIDLQ
jgi:hypothetical protein